MKIFVKNFSPTTTEEELQKIFDYFGPVHSLSIIKDSYTGDSKGFGFVEMEEEAGVMAIESLRGLELEGRSILVKRARAKIKRRQVK